jgi:hypothetical protein
MEIVKKIKNTAQKIMPNTIDFKNSKSITWNSKRRFGL